MTPHPTAPRTIVAAGLSPAWQSIMRFDSLLPGEVNRAAETWRCASGKVLNVAVALRALACDCRAVTVLGGAPAAATAAEFFHLGIDLVAVPTAAETRTCTTLLDTATGKTTELVENAGPVTADELGRFIEAYAAAVAEASAVVLSGSLPAGTPATIYRDLLERTSRPAVLDARGPELLAALSCRPLLVKPNREELARTMGRPLGSEADLRVAMEGIREQGAGWVLVTDGAKPAIALGPAGCFRVVPPRLERVVNPIGCGDCLAAGMAEAISRGLDPLDAIRFGMACAAFNCGTLLAGRLERPAVEALVDRVQIERV
jgi:1-phosphofructokinase family hexose kinase